jgi:aminoglycoside phosphotransferase (APT) family kinase protein
VSDRRRPLTADELDRLARAIDPLARPLRSAPLLGGLESGTYVVDLATSDGTRSVVVQRYEGEDGGGPRAARNVWATLNAIRDVDLPVPRPILFDEGPLLGRPVVVMTRCEGVVRPPPSDPAAWIDGYADALARFHAADLGRLRGSVPPCHDRRAYVERLRERRKGRPWPRAWEELVGALECHADLPAVVEPVLRHHDFWFGNTLWTGDRVTGFIDVAGACIGDPRADLSYARLDVHLVLGPERAEAFQKAYERRRGHMPDLAYFDLRAAEPSLIWLKDWVDGYHEVGVSDLSLALAEARRDAFIADAMARIGGGPPT